jgi:cysteine synthase B
VDRPPDSTSLNPQSAIYNPQSMNVPPLLRLIGNTPLIELSHLKGRPAGVRILAKAEFQNPAGSVKDRPAWNMVRQALESGAFQPDRKTLIDATSGNTGIAYAMLGAVLGFQPHLVLPKNANEERKTILKALGAELIYSPATDGSDGAIRLCRQIVEESPAKYFYPDQYGNPANWQAHFESTGPEILEQTKNTVTHFVAGLGTSGTFMGVGRRLRKDKPGVRLCSMQPDGPWHGLEGLKHMPTAIVPPIYDEAFADENIEIPTEEAQEMTRRIGREEGILVGISSGANVAAAMRIAQKIKEGVIVTIFCDGGLRYLSERFWTEKE